MAKVTKVAALGDTEARLSCFRKEQVTVYVSAAEGAASTSTKIGLWVLAL